MRLLFRSHVIAVLCLCGLIMLSGCGEKVDPFTRFSGDGAIVANEESLPGAGYSLLIKDIDFFHRDIRAKVTVDEDLEDKLILTGDQNILDTISISVDNTERIIEVFGTKGYQYEFTRLELEIGVPVNSIHIDGGYSFKANLPSVRDFDMAVNGSIDGDFSFHRLDTFYLELYGSSTISINGACEHASAMINGNSVVRAFDFITENSAVSLLQAGKYDVHVKNLLSAQINGFGTITYTGDPQEIIQSVEGVGKVTKKGE